MRFRFWLLLASLLFCSERARAEWATIVFEPETGVILHASQDRAPRYPASLTKIMTAFLVLESIRSGKLKLSEVLPISAAAASQPKVKLGLRPNRTITVEEALHAAILRSANDAAVVLAEAVAGSERAFARKMTERAWALGMRATTFVNATGLPDRSHTTTAYDMAILVQNLIRNFPEHSRIFSRTSATYGKKRYSSVNGWLTGYPGADGIKTGFTCAAGYNLVASAKKKGRRLVAVVMGGTSRNASAKKTRTLVDQAFAKLGQPHPRYGILRQGARRVEFEMPPHVLPASTCVQSKRPRKLFIEAGPFPGWTPGLGRKQPSSRPPSSLPRLHRLWFLRRAVLWGVLREVLRRVLRTVLLGLWRVL